VSGIDKRRDAFSPSDALLALPHADTDPILRAAVARLRVCSPEEVPVAIVETYSADRARLMAVATEALTKSPPIIFAGDAGDNSRLSQELAEARADAAALRAAAAAYISAEGLSALWDARAKLRAVIGGDQ